MATGTDAGAIDRRRSDVESQVMSCYTGLVHLEYPAKCYSLFGATAALQGAEKAKTTLNFCKRRTYMRYLNTIEGMFARELPIHDAGECAPFWVSYDAIPRAFTIGGTFEKDPTINVKGAIVGRMLRLIEKLHQEGFTHGSVDLFAFGVDDGVLIRHEQVQLPKLLLGRFETVRSFIDAQGGIKFDELIRKKDDLYQFGRNIMERLFSGTSLPAVFQEDVDRTSLGTGCFPFDKWYDILRETMTRGKVPQIRSPPTGHVIFEAIPDVITRWNEFGEECMSRRQPALREVDRNRRDGPIFAEGLGTLVPLAKSKTQFHLAHDMKHFLEAAEFEGSRDNRCLQESLLRALNGLEGFAPILYKTDRPIGKLSFVKDVFPQSVEPDRLLDRANPAILYRALAGAVQALELLHDDGIVHNALDSADSFQILPDGSFKLIRFDRAALYINPDKLDHIPRSRGFSRKNDIRSLALFAAHATKFQDGLINMFFDSMDSLGYEDEPDYGLWAERFAQAARASTRYRIRTSTEVVASHYEEPENKLRGLGPYHEEALKFASQILGVADMV